MRFLLLLMLASACGHRDGADFPATLGPLEENLAPAIDGRAEDPYPEVIVFASGQTDDHYWAHARGYVHASVDAVYNAMQRPPVLVDRREIDEWEVEWGTVPEYDVSLTLHQTVEDVLTVKYDTTWVMEVQGKDGLGATQVAAQWDKTDGTPFIDELTGSLVVKRVNAEVSEVLFVAWLDASLRDESTLVSHERDIHSNLVAAVKGEPLPNY
jgi:hypothetical protein